MFECPVKQSLSQLPEGPDNLQIVIYSYSPEDVMRLAQPTSYRLDITNFPYPLSFSALVRSDLFRIYGKALRFLKIESSRQRMVKIG